MGRLKQAELFGLLALLVVGLVVRVGWVRLFPMAPVSDYLYLFHFARAIAAGEWPAGSWEWNHHGYGLPLVLAPAVFIANRLSAVYAVMILMQLGMIVAVFWLGRSLFGSRAGIAAAAWAACLPGLWTITPLVAKENLSTCLLPLGLALAWRAERDWRLLAAGAAFALLGLTRANFLPFLPLAGAVCLVGAANRHRWRAFMWFGAGAGLLLMPVVTLNLLNGGWPLPTAAASQQLWVVHNERATGRYVDPDDFDDSPFLGFAHWADRLPAMRKLALQFVAANPVYALHNVWARHLLHWETDIAGLRWTYSRAPLERQELIPWRPFQVRRVVDGSLALLLCLAFVGAAHGGRLPGVAACLGLPLVYGLVTLATSEANVRYHVSYTPLFCVLAGAALMPFARPLRPLNSAILRPWLARLALSAGLVAALIFVLSRITGIALSFDAFLRGRWNGWVVMAVAVALVAHPMVCWAPGLVRSLGAAAARHPARALAVMVTAASVFVLAAAVIIARAVDMVAAVGAVAPHGWERYQLDPTGERAGLSLQLVSAGMPGSLRQVSYPDGVRLAFDDVPAAGTVVGLRRELPGLMVGDTYTFYLHVFDPGSAGGGGDLVVRLNEQVVWQRQSDTGEEADWHYVVVKWRANSEAVRITVEHTAGPRSGQPGRLAPIIRTLHLYPKY